MQTFKSARGASQINLRLNDDIVCILFAFHNHNHFHLVWVDAENNKNSGNLHYSHRLGASLMPTTTNYGKIRPRGDDRKCEIESRRHARRNFNFFSRRRRVLFLVHIISLQSRAQAPTTTTRMKKFSYFISRILNFIIFHLLWVSRGTTEQEMRARRRVERENYLLHV